MLAEREQPSPRAVSSAGTKAAGENLVRVVGGDGAHRLPPTPLEIDAAMTEDWLVHFIREEMARRQLGCAVIGLSGGVDSAVTACLAVRALGAEHVIGVRMPYLTSSPDSLAHAQQVIDALRIESRTIEITGAVNGYLEHEPDADPARRGNVMARVRMLTLFDLGAKYRGIPLGTSNKTERLLGYFTWHADDSPPVNPLGDLFKTQVWALARHLGVAAEIVAKAPTADLIEGQTDEGDIGISYEKADQILNWMLNGYSAADIVERGFDAADVEVIRRRLEGTHWKRRLADGGDAQLDGDRRVVPEASRLLSVASIGRYDRLGRRIAVLQGIESTGHGGREEHRIGDRRDFLGFFPRGLEERDLAFERATLDVLV